MYLWQLASECASSRIFAASAPGVTWYIGRSMGLSRRDLERAIQSEAKRTMATSPDNPIGWRCRVEANNFAAASMATYSPQRVVIQ